MWRESVANSSFDINLKPHIRPAEFERYILDRIAEQMEAKIRPQRARMRVQIKNLVYTIIKDAPEADALRQGGKLAAQFGLYRGSEEAAISAISRAVADATRVDFSSIKRRGNRILGRIRIRLVEANYSSLLSLKEASVDDVDRGYKLPWLDWLLTKGDGIIIKNYGVLEAKRKDSRSGGAVMLPIEGNFKIAFSVTPRNLSGTEDSNWLTRAIVSNRDKITDLVLSYLFKV